MCSVRKSVIRKTPWKDLYSGIDNWSNIYTYQLCLGGAYTNIFYHISICELVQWDGGLIRDGVRGGSNGAMYMSWYQVAD